MFKEEIIKEMKKVYDFDNIEDEDILCNKFCKFSKGDGSGCNCCSSIDCGNEFEYYDKCFDIDKYFEEFGSIKIKSFCPECGKDVVTVTTRLDTVGKVDDRLYKFRVYDCRCSECGKMVDTLNIMDYNLDKLLEQIKKDV